VTWFETMGPGTCKGTVLESDDLEADVDQLRVRGVTFEQGIQEAPWGRFVTFDDPDGNGLTLQETSEASP
jgi:predicted enzyme related to lactoylglutathione lyase